MKESIPRLNIGIITPFKSFPGGVETVNAMLVKALSFHQVDLITTEDLVEQDSRKIITRLLGPAYFAKPSLERTTSAYDLLICNGEFGFRIDHPCCINLFHGSAQGVLQNVGDFLRFKERCFLRRDAIVQRKSAQGKYTVAVSDYLKTVLTAQGIYTHQVIENAVDLSVFRPDRNVKRNQRCLFVGSPHYYGKGWDVLDALTKYGHKIDSVGQSPKKSQITTIPCLNNEQMVSLYQQYRLLLFPTRFEGLGLAAIEAMACGTPVLMNSVGVGKKLAKHIPQFVLDTLDPAAWDKRIGEIMTNREQLSKQAIKYVEDFHCEKRFSSEWNQLVSKLWNAQKLSSTKEQDHRCIGK